MKFYFSLFGQMSHTFHLKQLSINFVVFMNVENTDPNTYFSGIYIFTHITLMHVTKITINCLGCMLT